MSKIARDHVPDIDILRGVVLLATNDGEYYQDFKSLAGCPDAQLACLQAVAKYASYDYIAETVRHLRDAVLAEAQLEATVAALLATSTYEIGDQGDT